MSGAGTPLMQQYLEIKSRHRDAILFFRMGDFYEMFYEDAEVAARTLGLTLTSRNNGGASEVPLAGVPVKAAADYLRKLVARGFRVAICEQVEDPKLAKGVVKREVIETITPGAAFQDDLLDGTRGNYVVAVSRMDDTVGIAAADLSTGELRLVTATARDAEAVLARLSPREVVLAEGAATTPGIAPGTLTTTRAAWEFDGELAATELARQFAVQSLDGFGLDLRDRATVGAAGALLRYLRELQPSGLPHLTRPIVEHAGQSMPLDEMTRRNLELVESMRVVDGSAPTAGTLLGVLDRTQTPMGARLLRQWVLAPLVDRGAIDQRLDAVAALAADAIGRAAVREALDGVRDVERLASKAAAQRATPRELRALGDSLARVPAVFRVAAEVARGARSLFNGASAVTVDDPLLGQMVDAADELATCATVSARITDTLVERPPLAFGDEPTIRDGVDAALDELRALRDGGKDAIARIQAEERTRTGIQSLKVGYNRVFGYFIEITNANAHLVPSDYQRRQTLTNGERYVTPALKAYEENVLTASERIEVSERALFEATRREAGAAVAVLQRVAERLATLDVLSTLADVATREGYVRPTITDDFALTIVGGRHPVVEQMMPRDQFVPNDVTLDGEGRLIILTGPNMAGKSTILRQIGLIVLLAQVGSFVPAARATIGLVDRVFTRVGASDNLVRGQSTFMVEMSETSAILHTATARSLVLLDEIGRGTSTYDGVSIAWSVSEHLHDAVGCKTVFATHYHELTQLAEELPGVRNWSVAVREVGERVLFLHTLVPGGADRSYGIEVGRLAGLPEPVIRRAKAVLALLEGEGAQLVERLAGDAAAPRGRSGPRVRGPAHREPPDQLALFDIGPHPAVEALRVLDVDALTPLEALNRLAALKRQVQES
ncbi:MAG: DNA mismatch repair protein MutS [Gemmatimonadaceae bacterium]|nr:DNA mismatch repair protein MutS [Gemmatimonadaceae bacterium]